MIKKYIKKYFKRVFSVVSSPVKQDLMQETIRTISRLQTISYLHQKSFAGYKNLYAGKSVVLVGAGPSVRNFKPINDCVYVGLNRACTLDTVKFDYLFTIDKSGVDKIYEKFGSYNCVKFVGDQNLGSAFQIPESEVLKWTNVRRYMTDANLFSGCSSRYCLNIETEPLGNFNSVSLQAMQFILYTNPSKIYLVGIDCSDIGHFNTAQDNRDEHAQRMKARGEDISQWANDTQKFWYQLKDFADQYYPDTEIISVNPVGLRGLFKDLDQE